MNSVPVSAQRISIRWLLTLGLALHCAIALGQGAGLDIQADVQATSTAGSLTPATGSITFSNSNSNFVNVTLIESNTTCTAIEDAAWLSMSTSTVSIPPSSTRQVMVTFDASTLYEEAYSATICANTGTSLGNVILPVTFAITDPFPDPLVVYDDNSRNGFNPTCTGNGSNATVNFDSSNRVHSGVAAISASGQGRVTVSWCPPAYVYVPYDVSGIDLWIYLTEDMGQSWFLQLTGAGEGGIATQLSATLAELYGASIPDHEWINIHFLLNDPVFRHTGRAITQLGHVDFINDSDDGIGVLYIDDVSFTRETIFYGGF